jgi:hypothetical protein
MTVWVRFTDGEKACYELGGAGVCQDRSILWLSKLVEEEAGKQVQCLLHVVK